MAFIDCGHRVWEITDSGDRYMLQPYHTAKFSVFEEGGLPETFNPEVPNRAKLEPLGSEPAVIRKSPDHSIEDVRKFLSDMDHIERRQAIPQIREKLKVDVPKVD